jgi:hypothetical protein
MRTIKIPNCEYELYESIRDIIIDEIPFSLINDMYSPKKKIAVFNFWDVQYIPKVLHRFILNPPKDREDIEKQISEIEGIIKKIKYGINA